MLALEIDNPEIELIFQTKFNGNKNKFINFIQDSLKNLENSNNDEFQFLDSTNKCNSSHHAALRSFSAKNTAWGVW
jgi:hypothetical protein